MPAGFNDVHNLRCAVEWSQGVEDFKNLYGPEKVLRRADGIDSVVLRVPWLTRAARAVDEEGASSWHKRSPAGNVCVGARTHESEQHEGCSRQVRTASLLSDDCRQVMTTRVVVPGPFYTRVFGLRLPVAREEQLLWFSQSAPASRGPAPHRVASARCQVDSAVPSRNGAGATAARARSLRLGV